ncbi:MAG TPA: MoxR family ATPase [Alphaproteobacteria bacterium]|nr:MoxR family ATPase [Alphaproteobacteria bacterium]
MFSAIEDVQRLMEAESYIADRALATTVFLAIKLEKPIFLEGEAGVGKTEVAKVMAKLLGSKLIRLQCYEGLDANTALYEWNYSKQMLKIKLEEGGGRTRDELEHIIFSEDFLLKRPLLEAIMSDSAVPPVLLIDEVDRSDEEFEAFLLEVLSDFQITIPEIGTIKAERRPFVILTSNRTREIHDALKRRCLYLWLDYPSFEKEYQIVLAKIPGIHQRLAEQICRFMQKLRQVNFYKRPGIAETLDWAQALLHLNQAALVPETVRETVGCILKYHEDVEKFKRDELERVVLEF